MKWSVPLRANTFLAVEQQLLKILLFVSCGNFGQSARLKET